MLTMNQMLQNRYLIKSVVGQGGMGAVYVAEDLRLNAPCVVKELLITPEVYSNLAEATAQFQREAEILANLRHPNLPRVNDYFSEGGNYYLVMDQIEGQSLQKLIGTTGLNEAAVLNYADQLLGVLEYIHSRGVLHRDIKPANIIIQPDGRAVLVDFGLVKVIQAGQSNTTRRFLRGVGTLEYAPPEQYAGGTDQRSDVYSLGATLYHTLTGTAPTSATQQIAGVSLPPPRTINATISPFTEGAIIKAMSLSAGQRFQTAAEFRAALKQGHSARGTTRLPGSQTIPVVPATSQSKYAQRASAAPPTQVMGPGVGGPGVGGPGVGGPGVGGPSLGGTSMGGPSISDRQPQTRINPIAIVVVLLGVLVLALAVFVALNVVPKLAAVPADTPTVVAPRPTRTAAVATAIPNPTDAGGAANPTAIPTSNAAQTPVPTPAPTDSLPSTNTPQPTWTAAATAATDVTDIPTLTPTPAKPTCQVGQAAITSPGSGAVLRGTVTVKGTAYCDDQFAYYKFEFVDSRCGATGLCFVAGKFTQKVVNGVLMNWDTTRTWDGQPLPDGTYVLRLTVVGENSPLGNLLKQKPQITITIKNH